LKSQKRHAKQAHTQNIREEDEKYVEVDDQRQRKKECESSGTFVFFEILFT